MPSICKIRKYHCLSLIYICQLTLMEISVKSPFSHAQSDRIKWIFFSGTIRILIAISHHHKKGIIYKIIFKELRDNLYEGYFYESITEFALLYSQRFGPTFLTSSLLLKCILSLNWYGLSSKCLNKQCADFLKHSQIWIKFNGSERRLLSVQLARTDTRNECKSRFHGYVVKARSIYRVATS